MTIEYPAEAAHHLAELVPRIPEATLAMLLETVFFASLLCEEGERHQFNIVFGGWKESDDLIVEAVDSRVPWRVIRFVEPQLLNPSSLAKYAALARGGGHYLAVHVFEKVLYLTGVASNKKIHPFDRSLLTIRVTGAGSLRCFWGIREVLIYASGISRTPEPWPFDRGDGALGDLVRGMSTYRCAEHLDDVANQALMDLAAELIRRRHGGLIAILNDADRDATNIDAVRIEQPLEFGKKCAHLADAVLDEHDHSPYSDTEVSSGAEPTSEELQRALDCTLDYIGRLTMVDGAVLLTSRLSVVAFGAKLPAPGPTPTVLCPRRTGDLVEMDMTQKGTRHRSAACFVGEAGRIALIASADGPAAMMFRHDEGRVVYWPVRDNYRTF